MLEQEITNYWGAIDEISFPITTNQLKRLKANSTINSVGVKIENIENPNIVNLTFISFENNANSANIEFHLIPNVTLDYLINNNISIIARIAKEIGLEIKYVFLHNASFQLLRNIGILDPPPASGTRI